jgi:hypothetical protein
MPRDLIRDASVVGVMPSSSAAPPAPDTFPFVCVSAARMLYASNCRNSASVQIRFAAGAGVGKARPAWGDAVGNSMVRRPPSAR